MNCCVNFGFWGVFSLILGSKSGESDVCTVWLLFGVMIYAASEVAGFGCWIGGQGFFGGMFSLVVGKVVRNPRGREGILDV